MSLARNLRDLLAAPGGLPPDPGAPVAKGLIAEWRAHVEANEEPHVRRSSAPFFASDATGCARQTAYNYLSRTIEGAPGPSDPPTVADEWRFALGHAGHDIVQAAIADGDQEVRAVLQRDGADFVSSRADVFRDGHLIELKTAGGFKFKSMTTDFRGPPEGPSWAYVVQLALTAKALLEAGETVERGTVVVLAMENLSKTWKGITDELDRFCAEWTFEVDELVEIADKALARLARVQELLDAGELPPRNIDDPSLPRRATITDPGTGDWQVVDDGAVVRSGRFWMCRYCRWQGQCVADMEAGQ